MMPRLSNLKRKLAEATTPGELRFVLTTTLSNSATSRGVIRYKRVK